MVRTVLGITLHIVNALGFPPLRTIREFRMEFHRVAQLFRNFCKTMDRLSSALSYFQPYMKILIFYYSNTGELDALLLNQSEFFNVSNMLLISGSLSGHYSIHPAPLYPPCTQSTLQNCMQLARSYLFVCSGPAVVIFSFSTFLISVHHTWSAAMKHKFKLLTAFSGLNKSMFMCPK